MTTEFPQPRRTDTQRLLQQIWSELLNVPAEQISCSDSFLRLGGDSLLAAGVVARVSRILGAEIPLRLPLEYPVLEDLAARIDAAALIARAARQTLPKWEGEAMAASSGAEHEDHLV